MRNKMLLFTLLLVLPALAGCSRGPDEVRVVIETDRGAITVALDQEHAPITVANFLRYVDDGFYNETLFHRIVAGFMIQGGGMGTDGQFKEPTYRPIKNEAADSGLKNEPYTIAMARTSAPDSATNQFFINLAENSFLDPSGSNAGYAVFGRVVAGREVVDAIAAVPVESYEASTNKHCQQDSQPSCPKEDVVIHAIRRETPMQQVPASAEVTADLITPGTWHVTDTTDAIFAWAANKGGSSATVTWSLTAADGGPLPTGWNVTFDTPTADLGPEGAVTDHVSTMIRIQVPDDAEGTMAAVLGTGHSQTLVTLDVELLNRPVSQEGDTVTAQYSGRCTDDGKEFDSGHFPLTLGRGRAIKGFDLGLVGLALNETATLVIPAPYAYGTTGGPCAGTETASLTFDVQITSFD